MKKLCFEYNGKYTVESVGIYHRLISISYIEASQIVKRAWSKPLYDERGEASNLAQLYRVFYNSKHAKNLELRTSSIAGKEGSPLFVVSSGLACHKIIHWRPLSDVRAVLL